MNYKEMSDFDINKLVYLKVKPEGEAYKDCRVGNYCEYPSEAWPIILENKIGLEFCSPWLAFSEKKNIDEYKNTCFNENPLRAAMIVYLMMGESDE